MKVERGHTEPPRIKYFQKAQPSCHKVEIKYLKQSLPEEPITVPM